MTLLAYGSGTTFVWPGSRAQAGDRGVPGVAAPRDAGLGGRAIGNTARMLASPEWARYRAPSTQRIAFAAVFAVAPKRWAMAA